MADKADVVLEEDSVRILSTGSSPVLDVESGNHGDLDESDGDVRIGDGENGLKIGVTTSGSAAGNAEIRADLNLNLGGFSESVVGVNDRGLTPNGEYSLGSQENYWETLYVNGDPSILANGPILCTDMIRAIDVSAQNVEERSDRRLKTDVADFEGGLEAVLDLRPVSYRWADDGDDTQLGLIGQEVSDVLPEVVTAPGEDDEHYRLAYTKLVAVLVDALQEVHGEHSDLAERVEHQQDRLREQRERIDEQQGRIDALEDRLAALEES